MSIVPGVKGKELAKSDPKRMPGSYLITPQGDDPTIARVLYLVLGDDASMLRVENVNESREVSLTGKEVEALAFFRGPVVPDFPEDL